MNKKTITLTVAITILLSLAPIGLSAYAATSDCENTVTEYAIQMRPDAALVYRSTDKPWLLKPSYTVHFTKEGDNMDASVSVDANCRILNISWKSTDSDDCQSGFSHDCSCCMYGCVDCG